MSSVCHLLDFPLSMVGVLLSISIPKFDYQVITLKFCDGMANSVDPEQTAPLEAV